MVRDALTLYPDVEPDLASASTVFDSNDEAALRRALLLS